MSKRLKRIAVDDSFEQMLRSSVLPNDVSIFDSYYSEEDEMAILIVESEKFEKVGEGEVIPFY